MSYQTTIENKKSQDFMFYVEFAGISTKLTTHKTSLFTDYIECMKLENISNITSRLDRHAGFIQPSALTFEAFDSDDVRNFVSMIGGTETALDQDLDETSTVLYASYTGYSNNQLIYCGTETLRVNGAWFSGSYNVTRAMYGSKARANVAGEIISSKPRHWLSRGVKLYCVDRQTNETQLIASCILSSSPAFDSGKWGFEAIDIMTDLNRSLLSNFRPQESISIEKGGELTSDFMKTNVLKFKVQDINNFALNHYSDHASIKISSGDNWAIFSTYGTDALDVPNSNIYVSIANPVYQSKDYDTSFYDELLESQEATLTTVLQVSGSIAYATLQLILSRYGDQSNTDYDVFAGVPEQTNAESEDISLKRIGAGIDSDTVDIPSFLSMGEERINTIIDEPIPLFEFIKNEILWRAGGYIHVNNEGKIAFKKYSPIAIRSLVERVDEDDILVANTGSVYDESSRIAKAIFNCNFYPERGFLKHLEIRFSGEAQLYGELRSNIEFNSKSLWIGSSNGVDSPYLKKSLLDIQIMLERIKQRQIDSSHKIRIILPWQFYFKTLVGEYLNVVDSRLPSHNSLDTLDANFEVVGRDVNAADGTIIIDLEGVPTGVLVAPSLQVQSYNAGTFEITINNSGSLGDTVLYDEKAANDFPKTCIIRIWRVASDFSTYEDNTCDLASIDNALVLKFSPSTNPVSGDIITILDGDDTGNLNDVGADVQDFGYGADSSYQVGSGSYLRDGSRWG